MSAWFFGLALFALTLVLVGIGCYCLSPSEKEEPPYCHICGKECEEITAIPIGLDSYRESVPEGAVWLCRGRHTGDHHKIMYYRRLDWTPEAEKKPEPFSEL